MAYTPNIWVDREGTTRYFETVDNDGALIFTPDYTQVTEMGTPVNADNMNHIEEGIAAGSFTKYKSTTTYVKDDLVTAIVDNELKVYKSLQDNNNANALTNTNFWEEVEFAGGGGGTYAMFDPVIKDHVLTYEETKGLALQGTYVYKTAIAGSRYGYPDFYAKCLEEKSQATATSTTLGETAITLYIHANGHTYYDIAQKSIVDTFYNSTGIAWFYGIDTANERVFLPRNDYFFQLTGDASEINEYVSAGLPNITGYLDGTAYAGSGAFSDAGWNANGGHDGDTRNMNFDASLCSPIYGNSNTVQPPASKKLLYICVGNTESDTSWIDVVTQVEGGVKDLEDKTNEGLSALANASNALRTTQITNCLLEVPQNIKLELANGVLTLKAGSTVIVPNGVGVFDEVVIDTDKTLTNSFSGTYDDIAVAVRIENGILIGDVMSVRWCSGATDTLSSLSGTHFWYDTTNNVVKIMSGTTQTGTASFPICLMGNVGGEGFKTINQVFNGIGYIGSHIWVDKGVKALAPNERNADETLNNYEITTQKVTVFTRSLNGDIPLWLYSTGGLGLSAGIAYDEKRNVIYVKADKNNTSICCQIAMTNLTNGVVNSLQPKLPFRAVDYNDLNKQKIVSWCAPDYNNAQTKSTNTQYTATQAGYVYAYGFTQSSAVKIIINDVTYEIGGRSDSYGGGASCFIPVDKNDTYKTTGNVSTVKFIPMKGAN